MVSINQICESPALTDFLLKVREDEAKFSRFQVPVYGLELYDDATLAVSSQTLTGRFPIADKALADMAQIAGVHSLFFVKKCDPKLRAIIFNYLLRRNVPADKQFIIMLRDQEELFSIQNDNLLFAERAPILDSVSNAKPKDVSKDNLKVVVYDWNRQFDISIIAPTLRCKPKEDDIVAFGVNVAQGRDGSIQVQGAAWRLACRNGSINRVCDSRQHRIRRPTNRPDGQSQFLSRISVLAQEAWGQWSHQVEELKKLTEVALDQDHATALRSRLRQAPFFLSLKVVNQILERLQLEIAQHEGGPTLYDLWNAMTYLGTHEQGLSHTYRSRLRYGAGEFTRHRSRVCKACRQLLLS